MLDGANRQTVVTVVVVVRVHVVAIEVEVVSVVTVVVILGRRPIVTVIAAIVGTVFVDDTSSREENHNPYRSPDSPS